MVIKEVRKKEHIVDIIYIIITTAHLTLPITYLTKIICEKLTRSLSMSFFDQNYGTLNKINKYKFYKSV